MTKQGVNALKMIREKIDLIDYKIHDLLNQRANFALKIATLKIQQDGENTNFFRPEREAEILRKIGEYNKGPLSSQAVANIFHTIMQECLAIQQTRQNKND